MSGRKITQEQADAYNAKVRELRDDAYAEGGDEGAAQAAEDAYFEAHPDEDLGTYPAVPTE